MARSLWTGSISFGLVSIPVRLFPAIREHDVHFHQVAPDGSRIRYKRVSEKSGREVDYERIRKAYEISRGKVVVFEQDELDDLHPASTKTIDIEDFVALEDIDPLFFERTYHLAPNDDGAKKAYALLAAVMEDRHRVGIGSVVMREKQYLCAIRPYGKGLALSTMLFADEVVAPQDVEDVPTRRPKITDREKALARRIVDSLERDWDPRRYHDTYQEQLRDIIRKKQKGQSIEVEEEAEAQAEVIDLMEALEASLNTSKSKRASKARRKSAKKTARATSAKKRKSSPARRTTKRTARARSA